MSVISIRACIALSLGLSLPVCAGAQEADGSAPQTPQKEAKEKNAATLPAVTVAGQAQEEGTAAEAYRANTANTGVLGKTALRDTPYSIEVFTRDLIANKQARSIVEAGKGDASLTATRSGVASETAAISVRGLPLDNRYGYKIDGLNLYGFGVDLPLEHFESVEVLKGATGFLYGQAQPGGVVNYLSKRPTASPLRSVQMGVTDSGTVLWHGDLGGRFGDQGRFGYRLNAVHEEGDTYINDGGKIKRQSGSLALDWRLTPDVVWSADVLSRDRKVHGMYWALVPNADAVPGNYVLAQPPAPIDGSRRLASPFSSFETELLTYSTELAVRMAPQTELRVSYRRSEQHDSYREGALFANAAGDYSEVQGVFQGKTQSDHTQAALNGTFKSAAIEHQWALGAEYNQTRYKASDTNEAFLGFGQLSNPAQFDDPGLDMPGISNDYGRAISRSIFLSDTIRWNERWDSVIGVRRNAIVHEPYARSATTPTLALIFKPATGVSVYTSYVEALEEGNVAPFTAANANQVFEPLKSRQVEVGVKTEGMHWGANAALFRLERGLAYTTTDNFFTQDGEARYDGLELSGKARLGTQWLLNASALWLDARNRKTADLTLLDKRAAGTSPSQFSTYLEYTVPAVPVVLSAGAQRYSKRPLDGANTVILDAYTLFDIGARWNTQIGSVKTILRANIDNLSDRAYWQGSDGFILTQGAPRTARLSAQFDF